MFPSSFDTWLKQSRTSGSFSEKDNRTPEENELIQLRKDNQRLMMENDILKQAALIIGRNNQDKYPISAVCDVLNLPRSTFYYEPIEKERKNELNQVIQTILPKVEIITEHAK